MHQAGTDCTSSISHLALQAERQSCLCGRTRHFHQHDNVMLKRLGVYVGQPECAYYLRHGRCGFGPSCKFHHPEPGTAGAPSTTADHEAALLSESASTSVPLPEAAVAHPQSQPDPQAQPASPSLLAGQQESASQALPAAHEGTNEASASVAQAQQPQYVMTQPQYVMATVPGSQHATTAPPQVQVSQPQTVLGQVRPGAQPQYTTATTSHLSQPQYAAIASQQLQQQLVQQPMMQSVPIAQSPAVPAPESTAQEPQLPATTVSTTPITTAAGSQQPTAQQSHPSAFVPIGTMTMPPQLQFQAQTPQTSVPVTTVALPQYQAPLRSASVPAASLPSMQAQSPAPMPAGPVGLTQALQAQAAAGLVQTQLPQLVAQPVAPQPAVLQSAFLPPPVSPGTMRSSQACFASVSLHIIERPAKLKCLLNLVLVCVGHRASPDMLQNLNFNFSFSIKRASTCCIHDQAGCSVCLRPDLDMLDDTCHMCSRLVASAAAAAAPAGAAAGAAAAAASSATFGGCRAEHAISTAASDCSSAAANAGHAVCAANRVSSGPCTGHASLVFLAQSYQLTQGQACPHPIASLICYDIQDV